ncbi:hypothetical protein Tco_0769830 [Tanacetum coccineum]|uniref:MAK10-like protein n=1 Tax=Tanacetum coccineum TaxID=301880 RepID=A0ABQ4ZAG5_9ASTR
MVLARSKSNQKIPTSTTDDAHSCKNFKTDGGLQAHNQDKHELQSFRHKARQQDKVYEEREESCWILHLRTGIFYPKGHEGVMNEVPDGAAIFASSPGSCRYFHIVGRGVLSEAQQLNKDIFETIYYHFLKTSSEGDANPIRTLGDYSKPSHEGYRNTIELPVGNNVVPLRSDNIRLVQNKCSFHRLRSEDPNQHLKDFLKLMDSLELDGVNRERTAPLAYISKFSFADSMLALTAKLRNDILMFQQHQGESLSEA